MLDKAARRIGYTALALIFFISTLVIIRWAIDFVTWAPLTDGWAQAVGTFLGLMIAVWVMQWQHARTLDREAAAERSARLNMLKAIRSEIHLFHPIVFHRIANPRQIWARLDAKFPIYHSCAGQIGLLKNDPVRLAILEVYMRIGMFLANADYYSATAERLSAQPSARTKDKMRLTEIWGELDSAGHDLLPIIDFAIGILSEVIRNLESVKTHAARPQT